MHAIFQCVLFIGFIILVQSHQNERHKRQYQVPTNPFDPDFGRKLSESINQQVNSQLARNRDLIDDINTQVAIQLAPVHRMQLRNRMAQGSGGTCVITYGDKIRVVQEGTVYACPSNKVIRREGAPPNCTEDLVLDKFDSPCTFSGVGVSVVGNVYCFGNNVIMSCVNNNCTCQNGRTYTLNDLKTLCGSNIGTRSYAKYEYYPDIIGVNAIDFNSDANKQLGICEYSDQYSCSWTDGGIILPI